VSDLQTDTHRALVNIHIFPSPLAFDSQQMREVEAIRDLGLASSVRIGCTWLEGLPESEVREGDLQIKRFRLYFDRFRKSAPISALKYVEFLVRVFIHFRKTKNTVVNCHSLFVLPIGVLLKLSGAARGLIYDAHELETECPGHGNVMKTAFKLLERFLVRFVDETTVVSPSIADWYRERYKDISVHLLRNVGRRRPRLEKSSVFRSKFQIPDESLVFLYQGIIGAGRGTQLLIDVFSRPECRHHLVIMGFGPQQEMVEAADASYPSIHYHPPVPPEQIIEFTQGADVGLCLIENICLSNYYCLPNKLFEYLHSGIPVVASDFPDLSATVQYYDCGWVIPVDSVRVAELVDDLTLEQIAAKLPGVNLVRDDVHWEKEKHVLKDVFRDFVAG